MTEKQKIFIEAYIANGFNATRAAKKAGYSEKTAYSIGQENLKKPEIKDEIKNRVEEILRSVGINSRKVLEQLSNLAFFDIRKVLDSNGNFKNLKRIDKRTAAAISGIKFTTKKSEKDEYDDVTDIRFSDKNRALELLCKHLGLVTEKHYHEGKIEGLKLIVEDMTKEEMDK